MLNTSKTLALSPAGHLFMMELADDSGLSAGLSSSQAAEVIEKAFATHQAAGLLALAAAKPDPAWPLSWSWWREFAANYLTELCHVPPGTEKLPALTPPEPEDCERLLLTIPPMTGAEYVSPSVLVNIWSELDAWARKLVEENTDGLAGFLHEHAPLWRQVGRVCFHLAENRKDPDYPFAFLATYAPKLGKNARVQYQPLGRALIEYADADNREALIRLLEPVAEASRRLAWVRELVDSGDIYHPLAWTPAEAYAMLRKVPELEASGLLVRLPDWWKKRPRPRVAVTIGTQKASGFGVSSLLDFQAAIALDGEPLSEEEVAALVGAGEGLVLLRGQWVEVDGEKLKTVLQHWKKIEAEVSSGGLTFADGMRLLAGAGRNLTPEDGFQADSTESSWAFVEAGAWLKKILANLRHPEQLSASNPGPLLTAELRPYQQTGVNWLWLLSELGIGACLADDMGLGKTIQVIALLVIQKSHHQKDGASLIVLPASLLSNWKAELSRFAPSLKAIFLHPSETPRSELEKLEANPEAALAGVDALFTTYGMLQRLAWLKERQWNLVVLDEAQTIKNPGTNQTKAVKALKARTRLALTGTPVENRPSDLWSLFDFLCPGLLGTASRFKNFVNNLTSGESTNYAPLRRLVQPYILRRLKTDRSISADLPEKTEMTAWCGLSRRQTALYGEAVKDLLAALKDQEGIQRRGIVLASLLKFKQICNHPSQALGDGEYKPEASGKFARLTEIAGEIAGRGEKALIFTQFREMAEPLAEHLATVFGRPGLVLHGGTKVAERKVLVNHFQREDGPPFFVLSLKAAGVGLNLTAASHVIHFDRWWNPAVENQATDRAFRIGQKKNVLVHKFVCRGTIEEKIDSLIKEKTKLSTDLLAEGGDEPLLTEMDDNQLLELVSLDIEKAMM